MANKERKKLRRMSRAKLVDIIYDLREDNLLLKEELSDRRIKIEEAGSIAQASLTLQDIFISAQKAADDYLAEVRMYNSPSEALGNQIILNAYEKAGQIIDQTKGECILMIEETEEEIQKQWKKFVDDMERSRKFKEELASIRPEISIYKEENHE